MLAANAASFAAASFTAPNAPPPSREYIERVRLGSKDQSHNVSLPAESSQQDTGSAAAVHANTQLVRAYTVWPTKNVFCCWGHCMAGPREDTGPNTCAWLTMLAPMALFLYTWGEQVAHRLPFLLAAVLACFTSSIVSLLLVTFTDPGILPRNPDPDSIKQQPPIYRNRVDEDGTVCTDTWCSTCLIYRPPRASHCQDCDNCVRDFDHHCPFTRNCIGARNYAFFILFLISISLSLGALLFSCVVLAGDSLPASSLDQLEMSRVANFMLIVFSVVMSLLLWGFTAYHVSLVVAGLTTKEHLKGRKNGTKRLSIAQRVECCSIPPSELEPRRLVPVVVARRIMGWKASPVNPT